MNMERETFKHHQEVEKYLSRIAGSLDELVKMKKAIRDSNRFDDVRFAEINKNKTEEETNNEG